MSAEHAGTRKWRTLLKSVNSSPIENSIQDYFPFKVVTFSGYVLLLFHLIT